MSDSALSPDPSLRRFDTAREAWLPVLVATVIALLGFEFFGPLRISADWIEDLRQSTLTPPFEQNNDIVVLAITEDTLAQFPYRAPLSRDFLADTIDMLGSGRNIRALGLDVLFDQATVEAQDQRLREALLNAQFPLVVAVGEAEAGLTARQLAFQDAYLEGVTRGSAVLRSRDGVVRNYWPVSPSGESTLSRVLAEAVGVAAPLEAEPVLFHRRSEDGSSPIPMFPAHSAALLPAGWLQDKIVLVGADLPHQDRHRTPLSVLGADYESTPGVLIHAQMLAQILDGRRPPDRGIATTLVTVLLAAALGLLAALLPMSSRRRLLLGLGIVPLYWLLTFARPVFWHLPLPVLEPTVVFLLSASLTVALDRRRQRQEKQFMHNALVHYVAEPVVEDLLAHPDKLQLGGERRAMTFLFTDVAEFSRLAEDMDPEQLVGLMTRYMEGLIELVRRRGGTIGRLTGDGLLVFFGAPQDQNDHARRAVDCAIDMDNYCESFRAAQRLQNVDFGVTRIGVHGGSAVVGNVGGSGRFEYTAYGESINAAARLESFNRHPGTRVCISEACIAEHPRELFRPIGRVKLKGMSEALEVYTFWGDLNEENRAECLRVYRKLEENEQDCMQDLKTLTSRLPDDALAAFYLQRLELGRPALHIVMKEK